MSLFEFLMVLVSLIIGLGIAELLSGVAKTIRNRETVRLYWIHAAFVVIVFLALLQSWWEIWGVRNVPVWTFIGLLMMLGGPIGLFLIAHLIFPERIVEADFKEYYYEKMRPVLWVAVLTVLVSSTFRPVILGADLFALNNLSSFVLIVLLSILAFTKKTIIHAIIVTFILFLMLADIILVNMEIQ